MKVILFCLFLLTTSLFAEGIGPVGSGGGGGKNPAPDGITIDTSGAGGTLAVKAVPDAKLTTNVPLKNVDNTFAGKITATDGVSTSTLKGSNGLQLVGAASGNTFGFVPHPSTDNITWTVPQHLETAGQVLYGDGTGVLGWKSVLSLNSALGTPASGTLTNCTGYVGDSSLVTVGTIATGTWAGTAVAVNHGGTGLTAYTSGGIPYAASTSTLASSALLGANQLVIGGGVGAAPFTSTGFSYDTTNGLLLPNQSAAPTPTGKASLYVNAGQVCTTNTAGTGGALIDTSTAQTITGLKTFTNASGIATTSINVANGSSGWVIDSAMSFRNIDYGPTAMSLVGSTGIVNFFHGINLTAGSTITIASGTNKRAGNATLVAGTITVSNTTVTANTVVILTTKTAGGTIGTLTYTLSAATSFTINSANILDTSTVSYMLIEVP